MSIDLYLLSPSAASLRSCIVELKSGSYDGIILTIKILGNRLKGVYPELYQLPEKWDALRGTERAELIVIQKKACQILAALIENPDVNFQSDVKLKKRLETIEFLTRMSIEYGQKLTRTAFEKIDESKRIDLDLGEITFNAEQKSVFQKCLTKAALKVVKEKIEFELPKVPSMPLLPSEEDRCHYWKTVSLVTRSKEGHIGVFYTFSPEIIGDLVVKAPLRPATEYFASRIFQLLGFYTPDTRVVDRKSIEGCLIEKALESFDEFKKHCKEVDFSRFFVMNRVYGRAMEEIDEAVASFAFTNDLASLPALLKEIGMVAAVDTLLYYQDRLAHIGITNWGNLMCVEQNGRICKAALIDQSVDLSRRSAMFSVDDKLERIGRIIDSACGKPDDTFHPASDIWEKIPKALQSHIETKDGQAFIQEGLLEGFQKIASLLTPETLRKIDESLLDLYTTRDFVDVNDLIRAQEIIKTAIGSDSKS